MIYLDNAASSWPKPATVVQEMTSCLVEYAANPGRSGHRLAAKASKKVSETRHLLAQLFGVKDPDDIIFTKNATESLNLAIKGVLRPGDHVITTSFEHNAVRRPLEHLKRMGLISVTYVSPADWNTVSVDAIRDAITERTRLIVCTHGSNVTGSLTTLEDIGALAKEFNILFLVDAAQTAGAMPIDVDEMNIDLLAFTGHKSLYGPQGTGGLYIHPELDAVPLLHGGTGGYSELIEQPPVRPDRYESGTLNTVGIVGLGAGVSFVLETGIDCIVNYGKEITDYCYAGLAEVSGVSIVGPGHGEPRAPLLSFSVAGYDSQELSVILDSHYDIAVRGGLHCAPLAHETSGTLESGLVRVSFGHFTTTEQIDNFLLAMREILS